MITSNPFSLYGPRIIGVELETDREQYTVVNCYGPANRQETNCFFLDGLNGVISNMYQNKLIVCGDFKMVQNNSLGIIEGYPYGLKETEAFVNIIKLWDCQDTCRKVNGDNKDFTWPRTDPFIVRRLDYIFCDSISSPSVVRLYYIFCDSISSPSVVRLYYIFCDSISSPSVVKSFSKVMAATNHKAVVTEFQKKRI